MRTALVAGSGGPLREQLRSALEGSGVAAWVLDDKTRDLGEIVRAASCDLVVVEDMPGEGFDALEVVQTIRGHGLETSVIVVGTIGESERVGGLMRAGASAFVVRSSEVGDAARLAAVGAGPSSPRLQRPSF